MVDFVKIDKDKDKKKKKGWGFNIRTILIVFIIAFFLSSLLSGFTYSLTDKIAIVPIKGAIFVEGGGSLYEEGVSSRQIASTLQTIKEDPSIKAVILDINSPGGSAVASEELSLAIENVRKSIPVYAVISETGASGAVWVSVSANKTFASSMSVIGSIGVTSATLGFEEFIKRYNITYRKQTSAEYKDIGSPFRVPTQEEDAIIQRILDDIHEKFVDHVATSRNISRSQVEEIATGEVFLGEKAIALGLVDEIGGINDAINELENITGVQDALLVDYGPEPSFAEALGLKGLFGVESSGKVLLK